MITEYTVSRLARALLEVIVIKLATSKLATRDYIRSTLLFYTIGYEKLGDLVKSTLGDFAAKELIAVDSVSTYGATRLGKSIFTPSFTPEDGIFIHEGLKRAVQAFVMDGEMHFLYMFTPIQTPQVDIN